MRIGAECKHVVDFITASLVANPLENSVEDVESKAIAALDNHVVASVDDHEKQLSTQLNTLIFIGSLYELVLKTIQCDSVRLGGM
ncbi:unnamed protein product [Allacma fusca]|uniref:Uncharacterized protein n=1 Tax=Allacma fusca TaxID=39272 RepID=A0A8J2LA96_9HEXA|nr:unnamed protein product [Allacma fusca]